MPERDAFMSARNKLYGAAVAMAVTAVLSACASTHGLAPQSAMNKPDALQTSATLANTAVSTDAWPDSGKADQDRAEHLRQDQQGKNEPQLETGQCLEHGMP